MVLTADQPYRLDRPPRRDTGSVLVLNLQHLLIQDRLLHGRLDRGDLFRVRQEEAHSIGELVRLDQGRGRHRGRELLECPLRVSGERSSP